MRRLLYILALFNALKSCSMSFKSGEYFGKNSNWLTPASTNSLITFFYELVNYPCSSTLGIFNDGNKSWSYHCSNPTAFGVTLNIIRAIKSFSFCRLLNFLFYLVFPLAHHKLFSIVWSGINTVLIIFKSWFIINIRLLLPIVLIKFRGKADNILSFILYFFLYNEVVFFQGKFIIFKA